MIENKNANKLIYEKSPYLLQHAHNPVDWHPWGEEAFEKARQEDKPIFLSIGYSTCHWCHVMERESFEDSEVASALNENYISIKVDREERPDIDSIYMNVCQMLTGHGGWPLTIIMTPDKKPFFSGTYFPKHDRFGIAGILSVLNKISQLWKSDKDELIKRSNQIVNEIKPSQKVTKDIDSEEIVKRTFSDLIDDFDKFYGGFGTAPKFPTPHNLYFLLRYWYVYKDNRALEMVEKTLESMSRGGIYDSIGYGFSRYSTDRKWLVPHFEKMLYDNSLLAIAYLETYKVTKSEKYSEIAKQIFEYILRDLTSSEGGFYTAEDADSEGEEGKFYVWNKDEILNILGEENGAKYCKYYNITKEGNFENQNIPNLIGSDVPEDDKALIEECRKKLFHYRNQRVHPFKDDKILTSLNGITIAALSIGGRYLGLKHYTEAAERASNFIFSKLVRSDGRLLARYRDGDSKHLAYVDDYSFLVWGLIELYETTYNPDYLKKALELNSDLIKLFWDEEIGGLFMYGSDAEQLITRSKEIYDGAIPSGNSVATLNFLKLARLTGEYYLEEMAKKQFEVFGGNLSAYSRGYTYFLTALLFAHTKTKEIIVTNEKENDGIDKMIEVLNEEFRPFSISMLYSEKSKELIDVVPFVDSYKNNDNIATAYVCENFSCNAPITDIEELREALQN